MYSVIVLLMIPKWQNISLVLCPYLICPQTNLCGFIWFANSHTVDLCVMHVCIPCLKNMSLHLEHELSDYNNFSYTYYSVYRLNGGFTLSTSPIQCTYLTLGNNRSLKIRNRLSFSVLPGYLKCKTDSVLLTYDYKIWGIYKNVCTSIIWTMSMNLLMSGMVCSRPSIS